MSAEETPICGIIMPISKSDEIHTEAHWVRVKAVLEEAIEDAGCTARPVWEKGGTEVIQTDILRNLFESDVVVCDISTRNPNVMLEWGMRLTTKKPTLVVAETNTPLPFDTAIIRTEFYEPTLEYSSTRQFIKTLTNSIREAVEAYRNQTYKTYLEHFEFKTVVPNTVSVTGDQRLVELLEKVEFQLDRQGHMEEQIDHLSDYVANRQIIEALSESPPSPHPVSDLLAQYASPASRHLASVSATASDAANAAANAASQPLAPGSRVHHTKFGSGTVKSINGSFARVNFKGVGQKSILTNELTKLPL